MTEENSVIDLDDNLGTQKLPNATAALVLGIISIATCWLFGVPGIICGIIAIVLYKKDKKLYDVNPSKYVKSSFANLKAGFVCGIIGLSISSLYFLYYLLIVVIFATAATTAAGSSEFSDAFREALEQSQNH